MIRVNGELVYHELITEKTMVAIPLAKGAINHVVMDADFTWNPKEMGIGDDERDLGVYVPHIGSHDTRAINPSETQWVGKRWADSFYSSEGKNLRIHFDSPIPNGASLYVNGVFACHLDFAAEQEVEIELLPKQGTLISLVPDNLVPTSETDCKETYEKVGFKISFEAI